MSHLPIRDALELAAFIAARFTLKTSDVVTQLFDRMETIEPAPVPELGIPFDPGRIDHWRRLALVWDLVTITGSTGRLLDLGCGDGWPALPVANRGPTVVGIDASPRRVAMATEHALASESQNIEFQCHHAEELPFPDCSFDAVSAGSLFEHCRDPHRVLAECWRVLRPGGALRVTYESVRCLEAAGDDSEIYFLPLGTDLWQFNLITRDFDGGRDTIQSVVFSETLPAVGDKMAALRADRGGRLLGEAGFLRDLLHRIEGSETEALVSTTRHVTGSLLAGWMKAAGFSSIRSTWDPARAVFAFLTPHRLEDPAHPFRTPVVAESVCASLVAMLAAMPVPAATAEVSAGSGTADEAGRTGRDFDDLPLLAFRPA